MPASWCGVVGLKPSRGRSSLGPLIARNVAEHGLTRSVRDTAALLDALHGPEPGDLYLAPPPERPYVEEVGADPGSLRVGVCTAVDANGIAVDPACVEAAEAAGALLASLGHRVEPDGPGAAPSTDEFVKRWHVVGSAGFPASSPSSRRGSIRRSARTTSSRTAGRGFSARGGSASRRCWRRWTGSKRTRRGSRSGGRTGSTSSSRPRRASRPRCSPSWSQTPTIRSRCRSASAGSGASRRRSTRQVSRRSRSAGDDGGRTPRRRPAGRGARTRGSAAARRRPARGGCALGGSHPAGSRVRNVVAAGQAATAAAGAEILDEGGSAADAAVAASLASCVSETVMTGLLGGGHAIHFEAASGRVRNLDCFVSVPGVGGAPKHAELLELAVPFGAELVHYAVGIASCGVPGLPAGLDALWRGTAGSRGRGSSSRRFGSRARASSSRRPTPRASRCSRP